MAVATSVHTFKYSEQKHRSELHRRVNVVQMALRKHTFAIYCDISLL